MKKKSILLKSLALGFAITLVVFAKSNLSFASEENRKDLMYYGLQKINRETYNLRDMKEERFEKLRGDLAKAYESGMDKVDEESYFYLLKDLPFTDQELDYALEDTGLKGLGKDFKEVSEEIGINPILLMAMAKHETGNGTSDLFKYKKNLFGFNAVDHDPYNKASDFKDPKESIATVASHLKEEYLDEEGAYYHGISAKGIGTSYATDPDWSKKVNSMMAEIGEKMLKGYEENK
ncbi:MAG: glucosaminidase domain-containing protein [Anaerococcus sp.]|nr:glucosaminidase domain-containing protein [Anaerococcus sp.]